MEKKLPLETSFFRNNQVYHLRVTRDDLELTKTYEAFKHFKYLIVAQEGLEEKQRLHQHILVGDMSINKNALTKILKDTYPGTKGNKMFSNKLARSSKALASYVIKGDMYKHKGFTTDFIDALKKLAYNVDDFKKKQGSLVESLLLGQLSLSQYTIKHIDLKSEHHQPIYPHHVKAHVLAMGIKTGAFNSYYLAREIFDQLNVTFDEAKFGPAPEKKEEYDSDLEIL